MSKLESHAFCFDEVDHLTRIHLKLALEDVGFVVAETAQTIRILVDQATDTPPPDGKP